MQKVPPTIPKLVKKMSASVARMLSKNHRLVDEIEVVILYREELRTRELERLVVNLRALAERCEGYAEELEKSRWRVTQ